MPFFGLQRASRRRTLKRYRPPSPSDLRGSRRLREGPPRVPLRPPQQPRALAPRRHRERELRRLHLVAANARPEEAVLIWRGSASPRQTTSSSPSGERALPPGNSSAARAPPPQEAAGAPSASNPTSHHPPPLANPPWSVQQGRRGYRGRVTAARGSG
jgi:hypothetical protein